MSEVLPVVIGLVAGIAFVITFSIMPNSSSLDDRLIASAMNIKEAQTFVSEYPSAKIEVVDRTEGQAQGTAVEFSSAKIDYDRGTRVEIRMYVGVDEITARPTGITHLECAASNLDTIGSRTVIPILPADTVAFLKETECAK
ncbi:MAG TPA: hypothetical protein VF172_12775 [Nitrososphaera sp.]|jgi:hypothetical protein